MNSNCVIMSLQDIEQMFYEIERRIGVHERDVMILEERCCTGWEEIDKAIAAGKYDLLRAVGEGKLHPLQRREDAEQGEAPKVIVEGRGGEDDQKIHDNRENCPR